MRHFDGRVFSNTSCCDAAIGESREAKKACDSPQAHKACFKKAPGLLSLLCKSGHSGAEERSQIAFAVHQRHSGLHGKAGSRRRNRSAEGKEMRYFSVVDKNVFQTLGHSVFISTVHNRHKSVYRDAISPGMGGRVIDALKPGVWVR